MAFVVPIWMKLSLGLGASAVAAWLLVDPPPSDWPPTPDAPDPRAAPEVAPVGSERAPDGACPPHMRWVPGGELHVPGQAPRTIEPFCLAEFEVSVDAYGACVAAGNCKPLAEKRRCNTLREDVGNHPANCVTWAQADTYCSATGGRLPSEWEWEWAARGGSQDRTHPWGEGAPGPLHGNLCFNECRRQMAKLDVDRSTRLTDGWVLTAPVGSYPKGQGRFGHQDLIGNVGEWTSTGVERQEGHYVFRGGSWYHHRTDELIARRYHAPGDVPDSAVGFRCAAFPFEWER